LAVTRKEEEEEEEEVAGAVLNKINNMHT